MKAQKNLADLTKIKTKCNIIDKYNNIKTSCDITDVFHDLDLSKYREHSSKWPDDNVGALGMYYTSNAWTDELISPDWGWFVHETYKDVKSTGLF